MGHGDASTILSDQECTSPWSSGRRVAYVLFAVIALGILLIGVAYLSAPWDVGGYYILMAVAFFIECSAPYLRGYGYCHTSFYVSLVSVIFAYQNQSVGSATSSTNELLLAFSASVPITVFALVGAGLVRRAFFNDSISLSRQISDFSLNIVRVGAISWLILLVPGLDSSLHFSSWTNSSSVQQLLFLSPQGIVCMLGAIAMHWLLEYLLQGCAVVVIQGRSNVSFWRSTFGKIGLYSAVTNILTFYLAYVVVSAICGATSGMALKLSLFLGLLAAGLPVLLVNRLALSLIREGDEVSATQLQNALQGANVEINDLKERTQILNREMEKRSVILELMFDVIRELGNAASFEEVCKIVVRMLGSLHISYDSCAIFLMVDGELKPIYDKTPFHDVLDMANTLQLHEPIILRAQYSRSSQLSHDEDISGADTRIFKNERSCICVPMIVSQTFEGCIYVGAQTANAYTEDNKKDLDTLATCVAPSISTVKRFASKESALEEERTIRNQTEHQYQQLESLQNMVQSISRELNTQRTINIMLGTLHDLIKKARSIVIMLELKRPDDDDNAEVDDTDRKFFVVACDSPGEEELRPLVVVPGEGFIGQALLSHHRIYVEDFRGYHCDAVLAEELSAVCAPMLAENTLLGCVYIGAENAKAFTESDVNLIETVAAQAALAVNNSLLLEKTRHLALTDGLTGLYTHRFFKEQIKLRVDDAQRNNKPCCLIMIDADKFKQYNDTLGHPAGDSLLKEMADILLSSVRSNDVVCRQGGDEFSIIMKDCAKVNALETANRIHDECIRRFGGRRVQVTASIGLSCFPEDADDFSSFLQRADEALYEAKRTGRNRVCVAHRREDDEPVPNMKPLPRE